MRGSRTWFMLPVLYALVTQSVAWADDSEVVITSTPIVGGQVGQPYIYEVHATSRNGGMITFNLHDAPAGMTIDPTTGIVEWTPTRTGAFRVRVRARAGGNSPLHGGEAEQEYTLRVFDGRPAALRGMVRNQQGMGVPEVRIRVFAVSGSHFLFSAMTDSAGRYSLTGISPGTFLLRASPRGGTMYAEQWYNGVRRIQDATPVVVPESSTVTVNFVLSRRDSLTMFTIAGVVRDTARSPVARANVFVYRARHNEDLDGSGFNFEGLDDHDRDQGLVTMLTTDSLGRFSTRLPSERFILAARKDGFSTQFWNHKSNPLDADRLRLVRDTSGINFDLTRLPASVTAISGSITSRLSQAPVMSHVVGLHRLTPRGSFTGFIRHAQTDTAGRYSLSSLRNGYYVVLAVPQGEYLPTFYDTTGGTTRLSAAFPVAANNSTVSNINIQVFPDTVDGMNRVQGIVASAGVGVPGAVLYAHLPATDVVVGAAVSEADGAYRLVGLAPGNYALGTVKSGFEPAGDLLFTITSNGNFPSTLTQNVTLTQSPTAAGEELPNIPGVFSLSQNYPNPFNPTTSFEFKVPSSELVTLTVYDILGREVATLVNEVKQPGTHTVQWDASRQASGVYFYRLRAGQFEQTRKLILMK